jgi:hypothetical protein
MNRLRGEFRQISPDHYALDDRTFHMESDFAERLHLSPLPTRKERTAPRLAMGLAVMVAVLAIFQLFFRYEYLTSAGTVFRIDRITHQVCRVTLGKVDCAPGIGPSVSTSVSTSTSTSLSR